MAFLSCLFFSVLGFFCFTSCLNFTAQLYSSNYFHWSHFPLCVQHFFCFCTNLALFTCDLSGTVVWVGLLHGLLILWFCIQHLLRLSIVCHSIHTERGYFLFCFCIWHIVRNLSYRSILIEFAWMCFFFTFSFGLFD